MPKVTQQVMVRLELRCLFCPEPMLWITAGPPLCPRFSTMHLLCADPCACIVPGKGALRWHYHYLILHMRKLRPQEGRRLDQVTKPSQTEPRAWVGAGRAGVQGPITLSCPQGDPVCSRYVRRRGGSGPQTQLVGTGPAGKGLHLPWSSAREEGVGSPSWDSFRLGPPALASSTLL